MGLEADRPALASRLQATDLAIALTSECELELTALSLRHVSPTELLSTSLIRTIAQRSLRARDHFMAEICSGENFDGIDWPSLFLEDNYLLFFRDVLFAQSLGQRLREEGIEDVSWETTGNASALANGDIFRQSLASVDGLRVSFANNSPTSFAWQNIVDPLKRMSRRIRNRTLDTPVASRVIAVFSTRQWERFRSSLIDLQTTFGDDFQLWYLGSAGKDLITWSRDHRIRLRNVPHPTTVDPDITQFFKLHQDRWADQGRYKLADELECPALASKELLASTDLFLGYTLPRTAQWGRDLKRLFEQSGPELIVGSAAFTYQTTLPYHVANNLGLISVALSHTYVSGDHSPVPSSYLACRNRFERQGFRRSFPVDERIRYCHNSSDSLSYQADPSLHINSGKRPLVAMLTASSTIGKFLTPIMDIAEYSRTLRALASPPPELSGLDFAFKSHPRFDISRPLADALEQPNVRVVPPTASVTSLLEDAWLVVVFNHYGGVVVDAIASGKPIIFVDSAGYFFPRVETLGYEAGEVVHTVDEFWPLVLHLAKNRDRYDLLASQCHRFASSYLKPSAESLGHSLAQLLT